MKFKLKSMILFMVFVPFVALAIGSFIVSVSSAQSLVSSETELALQVSADAMSQAYQKSDPGQYFIKDGKVYKGEYCISEQAEIVDAIAHTEGYVATFFWGNTRAMTSIYGDNGQRIIGTTTTDANVLQNVLKDGKSYFNPSLEINGTKYFVIYSPVFQEGSSEIIGMTFVGRAVTSTGSAILGLLIKLVVVMLVIAVVFVFVTLYFTGNIVNPVKKMADVMGQCAEGNLTVNVDEKILARSDEIGDIGSALNTQIGSIRGMISSISEKSEELSTTSETLDRMAEETARTITQVENAVNDIAEGATAQAGDTTRASTNVMDMGEIISGTVSDVSELATTSEKMSESGRTAMEILEELKGVNERAINAIEIVYEQTNVTNESAIKIREATDIIASIAEETNLLSLNASIEAARAGDAGRGFAVVADQISKLAEQSNNSAHEIELITTSLIEDSNKSVETMNEVKEIMSLQSEKMNTTTEAFGVVSEGIGETRKSVDTINDRSKKLDAARKEIIDVIQSLTAIAEENAASTQETSAATSEVTAAADSVSKSAIRLKEVTAELESNVSQFRV